jgi:hypothetical protein
MARKFQYLITLEIDGAHMYTGKYNTYNEILESFQAFLSIENIRKHCHKYYKNAYKKTTARGKLYRYVNILKVSASPRDTEKAILIKFFSLFCVF